MHEMLNSFKQTPIPKFQQKTHQFWKTPKIFQKPQNLGIATFIGTAEPWSFDALVSKASNVERQIARQKSTMQRGRNLEEKNTEGKKPQNNGEVMATFVNNGWQNGKGKEGSK